MVTARRITHNVTTGEIIEDTFEFTPPAVVEIPTPRDLEAEIDALGARIANLEAR